MKNLLSTGQAANLLGTTEPRLSEVVRRKKVAPAPWVVAGRRLWSAQDLAQAAEALGVLTPAIKEAIDQVASRVDGGFGESAPVTATVEQEAARAS